LNLNNFIKSKEDIKDELKMLSKRYNLTSSKKRRKEIYKQIMKLEEELLQ